MTVFYAYIHNIRDDNTWRLILTFASRSVADEWWRTISTSANKDFVTRTNPQFYTHDPGKCNVFEFFYHQRFKPTADQFRGKLFITLMNDRGGRTLSIIPSQEVTDHVSGNSFHIRSKVDPTSYWYFDPATSRMRVSNKQRTPFRIRIKDDKFTDGTIMVDADDIIIAIDGGKHVDFDSAGYVTAGAGPPRGIKFGDLQSRFKESQGGLQYLADQRSDVGGEGWELV